MNQQSMTVIVEDGVEYYIKPGGAKIIKSVWDNLYGIGKPKQPILKQNDSKGDNPDRRNNWMKNKKSY